MVNEPSVFEPMKFYCIQYTSSLLYLGEFQNNNLRWPTLISVAQRSAHCRHSALWRHSFLTRHSLLTK